MAGTTPVTFENATTTRFGFENGRIVTLSQETAPRTVDMTAQGLGTLAKCAGEGTEAEARFTAMAEALGSRDAKASENTLNPSTPGFKPIMPGMKS